MAKIEYYTSDNKVSILDKVIGSDADNNFRTKNFTIEALYNFFNSLNDTSVLNTNLYQLSFDDLYSDTQGTFNSTSDEVDPVSITSLQFNVSRRDGLNISDFFTFLNDYKTFLLLRINTPSTADVDSFFSIDSVTAVENVDSEIIGYNLTLSSFNSIHKGDLEDGDVYNISYVLKGGSSGGSSGFPTQSFTAVLDGGKTLGTVSNGDVVPVFNTPDEMLSFLGVELILPTVISNNSITLSNVSTSEVEVGSTISSTLVATLNRGLIDNKNGASDTFLTGAATSTVFSGTGINSSTGVINTPAVVGNNTFTATINYAEGTDDYFDSTGASATNLDSQRVAGSVNDLLTIPGRFKSFFGYSTNTVLTSSEIINLVNGDLSTSKNRTYNNVTATSGNYTYYCYRASYGDLTSIVLDGSSPILGAFTKLSNVSVTNQFGVVETYIVYRSNATNAFTSNTLTFI